MNTTMPRFSATADNSNVRSSTSDRERRLVVVPAEFLDEQSRESRNRAEALLARAFVESPLATPVDKPIEQISCGS